MKANRLFSKCSKFRVTVGRFHSTLPQGPDLKSFIARSANIPVEDKLPGHESDNVPYLKDDCLSGKRRKGKLTPPSLSIVVI